MQWKSMCKELRSTLCIQYRSMTGGGVRITGEVAVSALSSPYLSMLRDCKCLVRCQVSVCLSQFPWFRKRWHTRVCRNSGSPRQIKQAARQGPHRLRARHVHADVIHWSADSEQ